MGSVADRVLPAPQRSGAGGNWDWDLDEGALWVVPVALIALAACGAAVYLVYSAPVLFAELLLDAGLAAEGFPLTVARGEDRRWFITPPRTFGPTLPLQGRV